MRQLPVLLLVLVAACLGAEEDPIPTTLVAKLDADDDGAVQYAELLAAKKVWKKLEREEKAWILRCHVRIRKAKAEGHFTVDREWRNSAGGHGSSHADVSVTRNPEGGVDIDRHATGSHTNRHGETTEFTREGHAHVEKNAEGGRDVESTATVRTADGRGYTVDRSGSSQRDGQGGVTWQREVDKTYVGGTTVHKESEGSAQRTADGRTWDRTTEGSTSTGKSWTTDAGGAVKRNDDGSAYYTRTRTTTGADGKTHTTTERGVVRQCADGQVRAVGHRTDTATKGETSRTRTSTTTHSQQRQGGTTTRSHSRTGQGGKTRSRTSKTSRKRR